MKSRAYRPRVMIGSVECICRCPVYERTDFSDEFAQTESKISHVKLADRPLGLTSKRRNTKSFIPYIRQMVHASPNIRHLSISQQATHELNELLHDVMDKLSTEAGIMSRQANRNTLLPLDIQAASMIVLPGNKFRGSKKQAHQALSEFRQSIAAAHKN